MYYESLNDKYNFKLFSPLVDCPLSAHKLVIQCNRKQNDPNVKFPIMILMTYIGILF